MNPRPTAIDLFAGAGGATQGLRDAGFDVLAAVELDGEAAASYRANHASTFMWEGDIRKLPASRLRRELDIKPGQLTLLKACPPCQGFSTLAGGNRRADDERNDLVGHTVRFVRVFRPAVVMLENVPGLGRDERSRQLVESLTSLGYNAGQYSVNAADFGVPQRRRRLIIIGIRGLHSTLPETLEGDSAVSMTVRQAFDGLDSSVALDDPLNVARSPRGIVAERIASIPIGGNRYDLPAHLQLACHTRMSEAGKTGAAGSYGRMKWDEPGPTMTTRCTTPACGSFIHPELNRAITLREAAALQTFPANYIFSGSHASIERQIGNAVPVRMATAIATNLLSSL